MESGRLEREATGALTLLALARAAAARAAALPRPGLAWPAGRIARPEGLAAVLAVAGAALGRLARRAAALLGRALPDILAVELLLALAAWVFRDAWQSGLVFHEADTSTMFYPVFATFAQALERGSALLWTSDLFSGFPLLAEGQTGVLYPPNHLFASWLGARDGFVWLRVFHFAAVSLGAYLFGRALRLAAGPAAIGAISFGYGSFMVGQMQHGSVLASAVWLPFVLACTEWGLRAGGLARQRWLVLAGLALGLSALGVHIQTVILGAGCFVAWVVFRALLPAVRAAARDGSVTRVEVPRRRARAWLARREQAVARSRHLRLAWTLRAPGAARAWAWSPRRTLVALAGGAWRAVSGMTWAGWALGLVPLLGMMLAAPQLLPLLELSGHSLRAEGWSYRAATDYSLPLPNLVTLVFPLFFRDEQGQAWSLWQPWEVTYYAGTASLALAGLGVLVARRREVLFFLPLFVVATLLALGDYSPLNLYAQLWSLPVMNLQRAPARFSLLGTFAVAMLAGLGAQALWERLGPARDGRRRSAWPLVVWQALLIVGATGLLWMLLAWREWLARRPLEALAYLSEAYLGQRHDPGVVDTAQRVYSGLWQALDPTNPHVAQPLLLLGGLLALTLCWNELRRLRALWMGVLVLLVAYDLGTFAHDYHPQLQVDEVADVGPIGRLLAAQLGGASDGRERGSSGRVLTDTAVERPKPNELLPWGVAEARGYDPLELARHRALLGSAAYVNNWLLDLLRVRLLVEPAEGTALPSYHQVAFHPQHPLLSGTAANPSGAEAWAVGGELADEVRIVAALEDAFAVEDGEVVGEWRLLTSDGREVVVPMLAGRHVSEWTYDDPVYAARPAHARAPVAFTFPLPVPNAAGARQVSLSYAAIPLPERLRVERVTYSHVSPIGRVQVYGFALLDRATGQLGRQYPSAKLRTVYEDARTRVLENRAIFPPAFVVPEAVYEPTPEAALERLTHGAIQPRRQVVLEGPGGGRQPPSGPTADRLGEPYGRVEVIDWQHERRLLRVSSDGGYLVVTEAAYPGWRALVDGEAAEVMRGNYLFQVVPLGPGERTVELVYQPESFWGGLAISRLGLGLALLMLLVSLAPVGPTSRGWLRAG